jgi:hypothetical protein
MEMANDLIKLLIGLIALWVAMNILEKGFRHLKNWWVQVKTGEVNHALSHITPDRILNQANAIHPDKLLSKGNHTISQIKQLNGWKRLLLGGSLIWLVIVGFYTYTVYKHQKYSVILNESILPVTLLRRSLNYFELLLQADTRLDVEKMAFNPKTEERLALVENRWVPLVERTDLSALISTISLKAFILWVVPIMSIYLLGIMFSWIVAGFKGSSKKL